MRRNPSPRRTIIADPLPRAEGGWCGSLAGTLRGHKEFVLYFQRDLRRSRIQRLTSQRSAVGLPVLGSVHM